MGPFSFFQVYIVPSGTVGNSSLSTFVFEIGVQTALPSSEDKGLDKRFDKDLDDTLDEGSDKKSDEELSITCRHDKHRVDKLKHFRMIYHLSFEDSYIRFFCVPKSNFALVFTKFC